MDGRFMPEQIAALSMARQMCYQTLDLREEERLNIRLQGLSTA